MNTFTPLAVAFGRTLLHSLWEGAAIAVLLAFALLTARSSRTRYAMSCLALLAILAALSITFVRLQPAAPQHIAMSPVTTTGATAPLSSSATPFTKKSVDQIAWLAPLWLAGVLIFYVRSASGWLAARRLRRIGVCAPETVWQSRMDRLAERLRVTRPIVLLESCLAEVPVVIGYLRPVVLVPVGLLAGLPAAQIETILLHELAHIRRHDYLANLLQVFVEGILFYHPAVWWISSVIRSERENCCDDVVVSVTGNALVYASALTALEERRENAGLVLAATGGSLVNRIQRVLGRRPRHSAGVAPVVAAGVLTLGVVTVMMAWQAKQPVAAEHPAPPAAVAQNTTPPKPQIPPAPQSPPLAAQTEKPGDDETWADHDAAYIITNEEKKAFRQLDTDQKRAEFIEEFWLRRDPTPGTEENEMKDEHYRRIAYADENFTGTVAGWRTDRGRIYIQYGPPDEKESHPGTLYTRPAEQGGGLAQTYPFEQWRYKWIEGVGNNVIIEFVDKDGNGDYPMSFDPREKDLLMQYPGGQR